MHKKEGNARSQRQLSNQETRTLIDFLYNKEQQDINRQRNASSAAKARARSEARNARDQALQLLDLETRAEPSGLETDLIENIWRIDRAGVRFAYEAFVNLRLRGEYLQKLKKISSISQRIVRKLMANDRDLLVEYIETKVEKMTVLYNTWLQRKMPGWRGYLDKQTRGLASMIENIVLPQTEDIAILEAALNQEMRLVFLFKESNVRELLNRVRRIGDALVLVTLGVIAWHAAQSQNPSVELVKMGLSAGAVISTSAYGISLGQAFGRIVGANAIFISGVLGGVIAGFLVGLAAESLIDALFEAFMINGIPPLLVRPLFGDPLISELSWTSHAELSTQLSAQLINTGSLH